MSISQGGQYNNGKINIVKQGFTSGKREGFVGILGSNIDMYEVIESDTASTITGSELLNDDLTQYGEDYKTLRGKTNEYNKAPPETRFLKNYNIFINKITSPPVNQKGCVTTSSISNLSLADGFAAAYPTNFTNYTDAKNACKLWAAYGNKTSFAVNKDTDGKYRCYTGIGLNSTITPKTKAARIYTVFNGDTTSLQGGLFANGQIGVWTGVYRDTQTEITNMTPARLLFKFNSNDYSTGEKGISQTVNKWWGFPGQGGWGANFYPNDIAWWISNEDYFKYGNMGYFYYIYDSPTAKYIGMYAVIDNGASVKVNGNSITSTWNSALGTGGWNAGVNLIAGKNIFEVQVTNTGGPGAFVFYGYEGYTNKVWFKSGPGWFYSMTPLSSMNQTGIKTLNQAPAGFEKCDSLIGGGIVKGSIKATYGKNCSDVTKQPLSIRYVDVRPNLRGDYIQISQIVVNALVNGSPLNIAPGKTVTSSPPAGSTRAIYAIDGVQAARRYISSTAGYHSSGGLDNYWRLDLGQLYPVMEIKYFNRADCCSDRANGMKINLSADGQNILKTFTLTDAFEQSFNVGQQGSTPSASPSAPSASPSAPSASPLCTERQPPRTERQFRSKAHRFHSGRQYLWRPWKLPAHKFEQ
jgi:hypothetical protein